jgi:hypothetical protein
MKKLFNAIVIALLLFPVYLISTGSADLSTTAKSGGSMHDELELEVKVKENGAIGYAYCFNAEVINVVKGKMPDTKLLITVLAGDTLNYGLLSRAGEDEVLNLSCVFNKFNEEYTTTYITGFVDSKKSSWKIISISKP